MKCGKCNQEYNNIVIVKIIGEKANQYCCNCLIQLCYYNELDLAPNNDLTCDITKEKGAIIFEAVNEKYSLKPEIMKRLIQHNLRPEEWKTLVSIYNKNNYMLHDDFYTDEGIAIQPVDGTELGIFDEWVRK